MVTIFYSARAHAARGVSCHEGRAPPAGQESHERRAGLMNVQEIADDDR